MTKIRFTAYILVLACVMIFITSNLLAAEITAKDMVTYTRITPRDSAGFTVSQGDKTVILTFEKSEKVSIGSLKSSLGSTVRDVKVSGNGKVVTFLLKDNYHVRQFEGSAGKGFDILKTKIAAKEKEPAKSKIKSISSRPDKKIGEAAIPATIEEPEAANSKVVPAVVIDDKKDKKVVLELQPLEPEKKPEEEHKETQKETQADKHQEPAVIPEEKNATKEEPAVEQTVAPEPSKEAVPSESASAPVLAEVPAVSAPATTTSEAFSGQLTASANASSFAFYHGGLISVISDKDFKDVKSPFEKIAVSNELFMAAAASGWPIDAKIEKDKIIVHSSVMESANTPELQISIKPAEDGAKQYEIALGKKPEVLAFKHPLTGELMFAARLKNNQALSNNNIINSVGFSIIPSRYAIVIAARNEDVTVTSTDNGIIIKEPAFLHAPKTPVTAPAADEEEKKKSTDEAAALNEESSEVEEIDPEDYIAIIKKFSRQIRLASPENKAPIELKFADEMIRLSFFREAKSILDSINSLPKEYAEKLALLDIYSDRLPEAMKALESVSSEAGSVGQMTKFLSGQGEFPDPAAFMGAMSKYSDEFKARIGKAIINQLFVANNMEGAHKFLLLLSSDSVFQVDPKYFDKATSFVKSLLAREKADFFTAEGVWNELAKDMDDVEFRARAKLEIILRRIEAGEMPRTDAITKLNAIRHLLGARDFQMKILPLLAKLSLEERQYADGLNTLRYIATYTTDSAEATKAAGELSDTFIRLFNKGEANQLSPLDALSLYYEFRELTPAGEQGDEMIRNLADRLVGVELLDRAATLLNHQLKYRVEGEQKAKIGARLAVINLMNAQPSIAIDAIDYSEIAGIPEDLMERRKLLKSQALLELGRYDEALSNIENVKSRDARDLNAQILWKAKRWDDLISKFEPELNNREDPKAMLSSSEMRDLMRIVVSYVFKNNNKALSNLNAKYSSLIPDDGFKKQLEFLAGGTETIHQENLESLAKSISNFKTFMDSVKTEVTNKSLSEAIK